MDFFAQQAQARRRSRWFLLWYLVAGAAVVASYLLAAALAYALLATAGALPLAGEAPLAWHGFARTYLHALLHVPGAFHGAVALAVGVPILAVSALRMWRLREGGEAVAELLGARRIEPGRCSAQERRLLNVVEEMAVASGIAVPPVYLLCHEQGVNALVAGYSPGEAVIIVTRGALEKLTRDELQGVVAHEFSHILNGDMALNMFLAGLLAGLTWIGAAGERLALASLSARDLDGRPAGDPLSVLFGTFIAFVGFPGSLAADAMRARVSRSRELLADAASVQLTRNAEGIAGALDSLLSLPASTVVAAARSGELAHMFFAPSTTRWWGFASHPPIAERIRRAAPRFRRDDYRARRYGRSREVAVLDGAGNVVKHVASLGREAVGRPSAQHVDFAARLLAQLPPAVREGLRDAAGAQRVLFDVARGSFPREHMLTLADLAVPALKAQAQQARNQFLAELAALIESDGRVTLREFVLFTLLKQRLREGAGLPIRTRYRSIAEIPQDAVAVLSLIALAGRGSPAEAFARGAAVLGFPAEQLLERGSLTTAMLAAALERLRQLSPFAKPALLKACCECAGADGRITLAEAELVRMVAATLDCPLPPVIASA